MLAARVAVALTAAAALFAACDGGDEPPPAVTASPTPAAEATAPIYPVYASDEPPYEGPTRPISGLFTEPRATEAAAARVLGPEPASPFSPWDEKSVVLYDLEAGTETNLGAGIAGGFSPDGTKFAWVTGDLPSLTGAPSPDSEAWVLDLETGERRRYAREVRSAYFSDDHTLVVTREIGETWVVDLESGESTIEAEPRAPPVTMTMQTPYGYHVQQSVDLSTGSPGRFVAIPNDGSAALAAEGLLMMLPGGPGHVLLLTGPELTQPEATSLDQRGDMNLFLVAIESGEAAFVATLFGDGRFPIPFVAPDFEGRYFAWTDYPCDPERARTRIYDLRADSIIELGAALPVTMIRDGSLAIGAAIGFGGRARAFIDLETLEYTLALPAPAIWSRSGRYAAAGQSVIERAGGCARFAP